MDDTDGLLVEIAAVRSAFPASDTGSESVTAIALLAVITIIVVLVLLTILCGISAGPF